MLMDVLRDKMKLIIYIVVIAFVGGGTLVYLNQGNTGANQSQVNAQNTTPIATVNGSEISNRAFQSQVNQTLSQMRGQVPDSQVLSLKKRVLDQLIDREIIEQEVEKRGLADKISDKKVEARLDKIVKDSQFKSKEDLANRLKQAGRSLDDIRGQLKKSLATQKLFDEALKDIKVTDEEIAKNYEEVSASHILIKTEDKSDEEAQSKAEEILAELDSGKEFAKVAQEYSEGPSAKRGGKVGSFGHDSKMVASFEEAAFELEEGEISDPVKTKFGYHIIKVTDKKEAAGESFEKEKTKIENKLLNNKKKAAFNKWMAEQKGKSEVVINSKEIKGYQQQEEENYEEAAQSYKEALKENGRASYLYYNLAQVYQKQDKNDQAIETYQEAINKYPEQTNFYNSLASLYQSKGKVDKAINTYTDALETNKDNANLHLALGELYRKEKMNDKALEQYDKFSKLSGDNLMAHYRLYSVYKKMGLEDKAKTEMKRVKEIQAKKQKQQQQSKQKSIQNGNTQSQNK